MIVKDSEEGAPFSGKIVDLGMSKLITEASNVEHDPLSHLGINTDDLEILMADYPHVAPEMLLRVTGHTHASETYAVGFLCEEVDTCFDIPLLGELAGDCISMNIKSRPSMETILERLGSCLENVH